VLPNSNVQQSDLSGDGRDAKPVGNNLKNNRETQSLNATASRAASAELSRQLVTAKPRPIEEVAQVGPAKIMPNLTSNSEGCLYSEANMCLGLLTLLFLASRRNLD
jgi:hypothetical protein